MHFHDVQRLRWEYQGEGCDLQFNKYSLNPVKRALQNGCTDTDIKIKANLNLIIRDKSMQIYTGYSVTMKVQINLQLATNLNQDLDEKNKRE